MAIGRAERRTERGPLVAALFTDGDVDPALDLLELAELAWHDCYGEITPSDAVLEDILTVSKGSITGLIGAVKLAVTDRRDLRIAADDIRSGSASEGTS